MFSAEARRAARGGDGRESRGSRGKGKGGWRAVRLRPTPAVKKRRRIVHNIMPYHPSETACASCSISRLLPCVSCGCLLRGRLDFCRKAITLEAGFEPRTYARERGAKKGLGKTMRVMVQVIVMNLFGKKFTPSGLGLRVNNDHRTRCRPIRKNQGSQNKTSMFFSSILNRF